MQTTETVGRQHPVRLLSYTTRYFWLLLIPLARSLYSLSFQFDALRVWLRGAWLDLMVLLAIICFAWLRWLCVWFSFDSEKIVLRRGLYVSVEDTVFYSLITTLSIKQGVLYRMLGACTVAIATNAGVFDSADVTITMRRADADRLYAAVKGSRQKSLNYSVSPNKLRLILFSMLFSSALSGVLIIIALLIETGQVFDREIEARLLLDTLTEAVNRAAMYVPPIISVIIIVVSGAWALSFISNLFVFWGFVLTKCSDSLYVKSGLLTRNRHIILREKINYIDLKQSFLAKVFNVSSLHLNCAGYGSSGRDEMTVVLPITTRKEINGAIKEVFPEYPRPRIELKTDPRSYGGFYLHPILFAALPVCGFVVIYYLLPEWFSFLYPAMAITVFPAIWLAVCRTLSMFITGIGMNDGYVTIRYSRLFTFHTVITPKDRIVKVYLRQSPFQRISGSCTLLIYTTSDKKVRHKIYGLRLQKALRWLDSNGFDLYYTENPK